MNIPSLSNVKISLVDHVATIEFAAEAFNYLSMGLMTELSQAWDWADAEPACRAIVLCSAGRVFCAGVDFRSMAGADGDSSPKPLYLLAQRLLAGKKPCIAAVQGAAVGAGLGLAMLADQRVAAPKAQFNASFAQLGFHAGFGLTATLPHVIGLHAASKMLLTAQPIRGEDALRLGLVDALVDDADGVRDAALAIARVIAANAPIAVQTMRQNLRAPLLAQFAQALERELDAQLSHMKTKDFMEGISAMLTKRVPQFTGT
jgi:enoyl-CoA hydratase/carnithine racemase